MSFLLPEGCVFMFYRSKSSQRLISHDIHSNVYNYKSTFSVEIVPICKVASLYFIFRVLYEVGRVCLGDGGLVCCVFGGMERSAPHEAWDVQIVAVLRKLLVILGGELKI